MNCPAFRPISSPKQPHVIDPVVTNAVQWGLRITKGALPERLALRYNILAGPAQGWKGGLCRKLLQLCIPPDLGRTERSCRNPKVPLTGMAGAEALGWCGSPPTVQADEHPVINHKPP